MKVQKIQLGVNHHSYIVIDNDYLPVKPILRFIRYLDNCDKSINTVRAYANHLKLFWDYLAENAIEWQKITLDQLSAFIRWLRSTKENDKIIYLNESQQRKSTTINSILGCLSSFYRYHHHAGNTDVVLAESTNFYGNRYKSLLHHAHKNKLARRRIISVRQYKQLPKTITNSEFKRLIDACTNPRDRFLFALLYETGMRIGQALGLHHEDIKSWDNEIHLKPRIDSHSDIRGKSTKTNIISVSKSLMLIYSNYVSSIQNQIESNYIFLSYKDFTPLKYAAVRKLFNRLSSKTGIKIMPHMLRHTHATELMKTGMDPAFIQKRLGHASIQTTIDTYTHVDQEMMKKTLQAYWKTQEELK